MHRRTFLASLAAGALTILPGRASAGERRKKPNILFIAIDDLKPTIGCYGDTMAITPHMDRLAQRGTIMLNNHCQQAVCAPSRASLLCGTRPDTTQIWDLKTQIRDKAPDALTLPQYFKQNGYHSVGVGKIYDLRSVDKGHDTPSWSEPYPHSWDLPMHPDYGIPAMGSYLNPKTLERFRTFQKDSSRWDDWKKRMAEEELMVATECEDVPDDAYMDAARARHGVKLLKQAAARKEPFFVAVGFSLPHLPFCSPKKYWDLYDRDAFELPVFRDQAQDSPDFAYQPGWELRRGYSKIPAEGKLPEALQKELIHGYYAATSYVDSLVGRLIDTLDELRLADDTLIVLWGDHGWHLGDHSMWCKHTNFEQATRSPLIFVSPRHKGGQSVTSPTEFVDIFPTLCDLAGLKTPQHLQGLSLKPLLKNPKGQVKDFAMSQYPRHGGRMGYSLRTNRYRFTAWMKDGFTTATPYHEKYLETTELYDYQTDPHEKHSQVNNPAYAAITRELKAEMVAWFKAQAV